MARLVRHHSILTLGRTIGETSGGRRVTDDGGQVDDTSSFFNHSFVKDVERRILRVDGIGNKGVHHESTVSIDFQHRLKVLFPKRADRIDSARWEVQFIIAQSSAQRTLSLSDILLVHGTFGFAAAQCTAPNSEPLGTTFNTSVKEASKTSREVMSVLE
jgi:hypothetical protein